MKPNNKTEERLQSQTREEGEERETTTDIAQDRGETNGPDNKNITPTTTMNPTDRRQGKTEDEKRGEGNSTGGSKASESNTKQTDRPPASRESGSLEAEEARERKRYKGRGSCPPPARSHDSTRSQQTPKASHSQA